MPFYASYPVFPGRVFDDNDVGTFVAPASGAKLFVLRCHFILATIDLPRRARDKDRKR
jgi:hypothetical protein